MEQHVVPQPHGHFIQLDTQIRKQSELGSQISITLLGARSSMGTRGDAGHWLTNSGFLL